MIYQFVSGNVVLANIIESFNIVDSDWIPRAPSLINKCLADLGMIKHMPTIHIPVKISDYKFILPCDVKSLIAVEVNGIRLYKTTPIADSARSAKVYYEVLHNNFGLILSTDTQFQNNTAIIHYKGFPIELDSDFNIYIPSIPDNQNVIDAISMYILINILQRGFKHPIFTLDSNSPATNPYIAYYGYDNKSGLRKKAKLSAGEFDKDAMEQFTKRANSFLYGDTEYLTTEFKS